MTITNRRTEKATLIAAILAAMPGTFAANGTYTFKPKDFDGQSPCLVVLSLASFVPETGYMAETSRHTFGLFVYVKREDAESAENQLDDIAFDLTSFIADYGKYEFVFDSEIDTEEIEGQPYLVETHFVWEET